MKMRFAFRRTAGAAAADSARDGVAGPSTRCVSCGEVSQRHPDGGSRRRRRWGLCGRRCRKLPRSICSAMQRHKVQVELNGAGIATTSDEVLIELKDVHKSFGSKAILKGTSFKIYRGEAVGIIGASGTGKSTVLRIMAGLLAPDKGDVLIMGRPRKGLLTDGNNNERLQISMVFQSGALFDSLTVAENVGFLLYEHSNLPESRIGKLIAASLGKVGLKDVDGKLYPSQLSGGMKKRVALARAIVGDTSEGMERVIMYDEPTAGLDPVASTVVEDLMRELHTPHRVNGASTPGSGVSSYIVVTHQHSTIRRAVDRIIFLHEGSVAWQGTVDEFNNTKSSIVRQFASGSLEGPIQYS